MAWFFSVISITFRSRKFWAGYTKTHVFQQQIFNFINQTAKRKLTWKCSTFTFSSCYIALVEPGNLEFSVMAQHYSSNNNELSVNIVSCCFLNKQNNCHLSRMSQISTFQCHHGSTVSDQKFLHLLECMGRTLAVLQNPLFGSNQTIQSGIRNHQVENVPLSTLLTETTILNFVQSV